MEGSQPIVPMIENLVSSQYEHQTYIFQQSASRLFNKLPGELRNHIFTLVLTPFDDVHQPYTWKEELLDILENGEADESEPGPVAHRQTRKFWDDPSRTKLPLKYKQHIDLSILLTCKIIYMEAYTIPVTVIDEDFFWSWIYDTNRDIPSNMTFPTTPDKYFARMQPWQIKQVRAIRVLTWSGFKEWESDYTEEELKEDYRTEPSFGAYCTLPVYQQLKTLIIDFTFDYEFDDAESVPKFEAKIVELPCLHKLVIEWTVGTSDESNIGYEPAVCKNDHAFVRYFRKVSFAGKLRLKKDVL
jgi:hypothetical protein